ncbi:ATP-binding protein [Candidatus Woesearchaeota archaeon]|nr:ATP-binding protein [Candidatus Woesearchaeota archaeon]
MSVKNKIKKIDNKKYKGLNFKTTEEIKVPDKLIDQIIGQTEATKIVKKIAKQRRHLFLIGLPGVGKSLLGQALSELLSKEKLLDVLSFDNQSDENVPLIKTVPRGQGRKIVQRARLQAMSSLKNQNIIFFILLIIAIITPWWIRKQYGDILAAASLIGSMIFLASFVLFININRRVKSNPEIRVPKLLIDNTDTKKAPFIDASGAHSGALLGDVLHDPLQSFSDKSKITKKNGKKVNISTEINKLLKKHEKGLIKEKGYLAAYLKKDELHIFSEKSGKIQPVGVLSVNKYKSDKPLLYKITTESGKTLTITPEHKVAVNIKGKQQYTPVSKLKKGEEIFIN